MTLPDYKINPRVDSDYQAQAGGGQIINIQIADGPAMPHAGDPGLNLAWKMVVVGTPCVLLLLCTYDLLAGFLVSIIPESLGHWAFIQGFTEYLQGVAEDNDRYRRAFNFVVPSGLLVTFKITAYSIMVTIPLGILTGLCRLSKVSFVNLGASVYVEVVRGIPLLVQLFYIYYAIAQLITVPPVVTAVMAMSFCYGAYMGEVVRSGIEAIDRGQREAAMSLGFTPTQTMFKVILPQAFRTILPPVGNECIALLKDSSLVSVIAIADMMRLTREFSSTTFFYFESYTVVALLYLMITLLLSKLVSLTENYVGRYERR